MTPYEQFRTEFASHENPIGNNTEQTLQSLGRELSLERQLRAAEQAVRNSSSSPRGFVQSASNDPRNTLNSLQSLIVTGPRSVENAASRGNQIGQIWQAERERLIPVMNAGTNTIDANLKRVAVLQEVIRAFAKRVLPLRLFSTSFQSVPLQGTDEVAVPYFPLQAGASVDFVQANGYQFAGATNSGSKKITVNKRKYQPLDFSSAEFRRQPFFNLTRLAVTNAEKLAYDVLLDILSVVTAANFGASAKAQAANLWKADDVADLRGVCNAAHWPDAGRALIVNDAIDTALQKDTSYKLALNIGTSDVIQEGRFPRLAGFEYAWMTGFPTNAENLIGMAAYQSAILAAFCPVEPAPGVRANLVAYDILTDTETGITLNYRHWGNPDGDVDRSIVECAYGYAAGEAAAIKRLTSA